MLTMAGVHNGTETASSTKDQHELHIAKLPELRNKDKFGGIEAVDRHHTKSFRSVGCKNNGWTLRTTCEFVARHFEQTASPEADF